MAVWLVYKRSDKGYASSAARRITNAPVSYMDNWSMEPAEVWVPSNFQMANWTMQPAEVWVPGLPVEYASTKMFGSCFQTSVVPSSSGGLQLVANAAATEKAAHEIEVDIHKMEMKIHNTNPIHVFEKAAQVFESDMEKMEMKIHRYPRSIDPNLGTRYKVPSTVAIGPYHHRLPQLQEAEKVKHVAAYHCIKESGQSVQDMYNAVVLVGDYARSLYDEEVVVGFRNDDFLPMMFYDACFLVQYMLTCTYNGQNEMDPSLRSFFDSNDEAIFNDIMMLENQLPWKVVETLMRFRPVPLEEVIASLKDCLQDRKDLNKDKPVVLDNSYKVPHLLGLLRFYIVGRRSKINTKLPPTDSIAFSVSAMELAEIGITLTLSKTTELMDMGMKKAGQELSLPQLSLDDTRACILANMAAFELCTTSNFQDVDDVHSAVCSYLQHLAMIVYREEDVQELRTKHVLQGGGGLTNQEALTFFTSLQGLRLGSCYIRTMEEIESYRHNRWMWVKVHAFVYNNKKTIATVFGAVSALASILGTIISFKS